MFAVVATSVLMRGTQVAHSVRRADEQRLRQVFNRYASVKKGDESFMTHEDFIIHYLKLFPEERYNKKTAHLLGGKPRELSCCA